MAGAIMSFNQKSDVKNHLSARRRKTMLPFRPTVQPNVTGNSEDKPRDENRDIPVLGQRSGLEFYGITPIAQREIPASPSDAADEPAMKTPQV
jgi:hypothetical protein